MDYFTVKNILSDDQTGAARAAFDVALKYNIPVNRFASVEQNIINADGTLIFSRGTSRGETKYTLQMAKQYKRHFKHIDLNLCLSFDAASLILTWVAAHKINTLNVAGPMESEDPDIYGDVFRVLDMAYKIRSGDYDIPKGDLPKTVDEAIDRVLSIISHRDAIIIANMVYDDLSTLQFGLGTYIGREFGIWSGNRELHYSCEALDDDPDLHPDFMPMVIIEELWYQLQETHRLRIVR